jgi:hypothetical protein
LFLQCALLHTATANKQRCPSGLLSPVARTIILFRAGLSCSQKNNFLQGCALLQLEQILSSGLGSPAARKITFFRAAISCSYNKDGLQSWALLQLEK